MLAKFISTESPSIIVEKEYNDILLILEMVKHKAEISIFLDPNGDKRVNGRLHSYEYIIEENKQDTLLVTIKCDFNNLTNSNI